MKIKHVIVLLATVSLLLPAQAQDTEPGGIWTSVSTERRLGEKFRIGTEFEWRSDGLSLQRERLGMQVSGEYEILSGLRVGTSYTFMNVKDDYRFTVDSIRVHFQNRHRFHLQLSYRYRFGDFTFTLRERLQWTFKDETDRIRIFPGDPPIIGINHNRINPDIIWRNRARLAYNIPNFPITPSISVESYFLLNEPEDVRIYNAEGSDFNTTNTFFNKWRYAIGFEYDIDNNNSIELFGMLNQERGAEEQVVPGPNYYALSNWRNQFVVGISYSMEL